MRGKPPAAVAFAQGRWRCGAPQWQAVPTPPCSPPGPGARPLRGRAGAASLLLLLVLPCSMPAQPAWPAAAPDEADIAVWRARFAAEVDRRLEVPADAQLQYLGLLQRALAQADTAALAPQALLLVDRSEQVQAAFVLLALADGGWAWLGAAPASTGRVGMFDHFRTPLGVFPHSLADPDFRAEGTFNEHHIRGYGLRGMRVYDFGWAEAERGWGAGGISTMRLQVHATDPDVLEPRLGSAASKGCIRIPATLNRFIDRHGLLDSDYLAAAAQGNPHWVLLPGPAPIPWPGRYLVVVDSQQQARPDWARPALPPARAQ